MTRRYFKKSKRKYGTRIQKPIMLIMADGRGVEETQYFKYLQNKNPEYNIKLLVSGQTVNLLEMKKKLDKFWSDNDLHEDKGDLAYIVLDLDCDADKEEIIERFSNQDYISQLMVSKSCFQVWLLIRFKSSIRESQCGKTNFFVEKVQDEDLMNVKCLE